MRRDEGRNDQTVRLAVPPSGVLWTLILAAVAVAAAPAVAFVLWLLIKALAVIFVAIVIAQALVPVASWLERWIPRLAAATVVYLALLALFALFALLVVPPMIAQAQAAISHLPQLFHRAASLINRLQPGAGKSLVTSLEPRVISFATGVLPSVNFLKVGTAFVAVYFLSLYWLIALPRMHAYTLSLFPASRQDHVKYVLHEMGQALGGYVRGLVINAAVLGVITYIALILLGVKYPLVLALITALGQFVPLIGPTIAQFLGAALALLSSPLKALITLAYFVIVQQISGNVLLPLAVGSQTSISPLLITAAVFVGIWSGGIIGALIAIPLASLGKVVVMEIVIPAVRHWSGAS